MKKEIYFTLILAAISLFSVGCGSDPTVATATADQARGGQLYDKWITVKTVTLPTTMTDKTGATITNTAVHDFRCKNCHGWDYKGTAGLYGPTYQNKAYAAAVNFVGTTKTEAQLADTIKNGGTGMPAFGAQLTDTDIADLTKFLKEGVYDTSSYITLDATKAKKYVLAAGASASAGDTLFASKCAGCHGATGETLQLDSGTLNVGSHTRQNAYEDNHKIKFGHPGSIMGSITTTTTEIRDILAALCNRTKYPSGLSGDDATKESSGCGSYYQ